ncbi:DUF4179 domain-containing protein [Brevibacillus sp. SYP-B805]|uniref:DUF4179 domain-containing protein n=1 Tax=Brevibacillus sp. SYP-B805 TaxID=1578199 RepID=UPI0013E9E071|nr:DUF4179 domain-containing protein [Brevibacillus sp. SYP-B805]NGQ94158.1 DUF4179 domain-containing protein [Brevibacillus sp. SYP-B805]
MSHFDQKTDGRAGGSMALPEVVKRRIEETLASLPERHAAETERPGRSKRRRNRLWIAAAAVVLVAGSVIASGFASPTLAHTLQQMPILGRIFQLFGDPGLQAADRQGMTHPVNMSATDQGITLTITDYLYDGVQLSLGFAETAAQGSDSLPAIKSGALRYGPIQTNLPADLQYRVERVAANRNAGVFYLFPFQGQSFAERFTLELAVTRIGEKEGNWRFAIPIARSDAQLQKIVPGITRADGDVKFTVDWLTLSPRATAISYRWKTPGLPAYDIQVTDDRGVQLDRLYGVGESLPGDAYTFAGQEFLTPVQGEPKYLLIRPFTGGEHSGGNHQTGETARELTGLPFTLQQGEAGSLTVTAVDFEADKTVLHYVTEGQNPSAQALPVWLRDEQGNDVDAVREPRLVGIQHGKYSFEREYPPLRKDQTVSVVTKHISAFHFNKELEIKIPLDHGIGR